MDPSISERGVFEELELLARTPEMRRAWDRVRTAAIRGAAAGALIKGGLHTLTFAVYLLSRIRGKGRQRMTTLADVLRDTVLHTAFLAALGSSYTAVDEGIALVFGKASTQRWRALLAGFIAGQSLRITGPTRRHYSLATYILLRGLTLLVRTGNKPSAPPALRALLRPTRLAHGDTLLMCAAAAQILYSFIMAPSTLPPSYVRFITRMGGKDPAVWAAIREHAMRNSLGLAPGPLRALAGTPWAHLNARPGRLRRTPCEFFHPGQSCAAHAAGVLPQAYGTSLAVYVPFYLVSSVLVHRTALLARPKELLPKMALAVMRSSAFLSAYIAAAFAGACSGFGLAGINTGTVIASSVWAGGLATLLEKKSRRMELAMYCAARALEAFIRCCWLWRAAEATRGGHPRHGPAPLPPGAAALVVPPRQLRPGAATASGSGGGAGGGLRLDVLLFSLGCGAIMHCYSDARGEHRDVFRSKYLNVLDFIFGNEGVQQGSISHVPTNLELVSTVSRRLRTLSRGVLSSASVYGDYGGGGGGGGGSLNTSAAFASGFSPLLRSATQSQSDDLGGGGGGHIHHGGHGYTRYLAAAQRQRQRQLGGGGCTSGSSGTGLAGRSRSGELGHGGDRAAAGPMSVPGRLPVAPLLPLAAAAAEGTVSQMQSYRSGAEAEAVMGAAAVAAAVTKGRSGDGGSSHSSGEWEDVWAAATGSSPNAGVAGTATKAAAGGGLGMPRTLSVPIPGRGATRRSPFSVTGSAHGTAPDAAAAAAAVAAPPGALGWAARLMAGAFQRGAPGGAGAGGGGSEEPAATSMSTARRERAAAAAAAASSEMATIASEVCDRSSRLWLLGRNRSMRRSSTAPYGLHHHSQQALALLSDPAAEHCGRGRSSYKELQRLSSGGASMALAAAAAAAAAAAVAGGGETASPASTSSTSPEAAEAAAALFSAPASPLLCAVADAGSGSAPASPSSRRAVAPARARPVPVPNASSRTPAFRPRGPSLGGAAASGAASASASATAGPFPSRNPAVGNNSLGRPAGLHNRPPSGMYGTYNGASASDGGAGSGRGVNFSRRSRNGGMSGDGSAAAAAAVTFEPHGAFSHPSPVSRAPVWPKLSVDVQGEGGGGGGGGGPGMYGSAPEVRESAMAAALAEADREAAAAAAAGRGRLLESLELEVEVEEGAAA